MKVRALDLELQDLGLWPNLPVALTFTESADFSRCLFPHMMTMKNGRESI